MRGSDSIRTEKALVRRFGCRGAAACGLTAERTGLVDRRLEVGIAVAERHPPLANRHAAIGFAFDAAIDRDHLIGRAFDLDNAIHQNLAAAVHGNEIGRAIALAGHHDDPAVLQGDVCNQQVSDNNGRDAAGKLDELGLIDIDRDGVNRELGKRGHRAQKNSNR